MMKQLDSLLTGLSHHEQLSSTNRVLVEQLVEQRLSLPDNLLLNPTLPPIVRHYEYPLNPWPVVIGDNIVQQFQTLVHRMPELLMRVFDVSTSEYFKAMQAVYQFSPARIERLFAFTKDKVRFSNQTMFRADAVITENGCKILEMNMGSKIGGWQIEFFDHEYRRQSWLAPLFSGEWSQGQAIKSRSVITEYVQALVAGCDNQHTHDEHVYRWVFLSDQAFIDQGATDIIHYFKQLGTTLGKTLDIQFIADVSLLDIDDGRLLINGLKVSAFMVIESHQITRIPDCVFTAFETGNLIWPDNPANDCLNQKTLLGDLYARRHGGLFSDEEIQLIEAFIPFSVSSADKLVQWQGREYALSDFLHVFQSLLVIKRSYDAQGRSVLIGQRTSEAEWKQAVDYIVTQDDFLIQQYCKSLDYLAYHRDSGVEPVSFIWGIFGYRGEYGGSWIRLMNDEHNDSGVINSVTGAQETIVFEVSSTETASQIEGHAR